MKDIHWWKMNYEGIWPWNEYDQYDQWWKWTFEGQHRHSSSTRHFHQNHHVVLVVSWSNCQNFNLKFNFKQLCPLKSQNPTYGSQVMAIWNKMRCPPPLNEKIILSRRDLSPRDKIIFSWWMVQAESNVIKKWRFCWLHPPRELLVVSSSQNSNDRQLPPPHHEIIILSRGDIGKKMPPPHHEKIILSCRDKFQMKKNCPHPTTRKLFCLVMTNLNWKKK